MRTPLGQHLPRSSLAAACLALSFVILLLPLPPAASAQGMGADAMHSGPRFLIALASSPSRTAPLDVERSPALARRISLDLRDARVTDALAAIAQRSGVRLVYTEDVLARAGRVTLQADAITTAAALTDVLVGAGVDLVFSQDGDEAVLVPSSPQARRQLGTIVGRVTDSRTREGIPGAAVHIEGGNQGAITGDDGAYRIPNVTPGTYTLAARRIGYTAARSQVSVVADQQVTADFALDAAATSLDQVVVTGTAGAEQRRSIGNAVTGVSNAPEVLAKSASPNLGSLLNARAPGVVVVPNSGRLGAGPNIQIRGRSSLSLDNSPLIYIDGVRVNNAVGTGPGQQGYGSQNADVGGRLNDISPEDIESIEIIKGPAAATIYGTEAANGVIQIITKKGQSGKPRLSAQVQTGALYFRDPEGRLPTNLVPDPESGDLVAWNGVKSEKERGTPIFTNGQTRLYNLSLSGGLEQFGYYLSGVYQNDLGIEPNNKLRQFSSHANLNVNPSDKVDLSASLNYVDRSSHLGADVGASPMLGAEMGHSLIFAGSRGFYPFPPEVPQQLYDNSQKINRFTGSGTINHRPVSWFSHRLITGIDYTGSDSRALERFAPPELAPFLGPVVAAGQIFQTLDNNTVITADYSATARASLTSSISSATSVGGQYYRTQLNSSALGGMSFPGPGVETISATAQQVSSTQSQIINTTIGAYFQEQVGFNDRLFLTGAVRVDNNSAFGDAFKWVTYPKVSASWVVSEEPFWGFDFVNTLKLRAAYGESGRQPNAFSALRSYTPVPGPNGTNGVTPGSAGNPDLKPERGREVELGFDADLFDRLHLDFTYFNKRTSDEIVSQPVAPSGGFPGDQLANLGKVSNHGIELGATYEAIRGETVAWEITGNIATNKDRIEDLGGLSPIIAPGQNNIAGYPIGGYFAKRVVSADRDPATQGAINVLCDGGAGQAPVSCDAAPLLYVGTPTPRVTGSIGNTVTLFKRLRLYALVDFKRGNKLFNSIEQLRCSAAIGIGYCDVNYHPENYSPIYLAQLDATKTRSGLNGTFFQDASFAKLREVSASYTLPESWLSRVGVSRAVVTLAGRELHTWTSYSGPDPEVNALASASDPLAYDQGIIPPLSQLVATINLTF